MAKTTASTLRANFDDRPETYRLPLKKARPAQRHPTGPRCVSPDMPGLDPAPGPPSRRYTKEDITRSYAAKREKYAAIRRDAGNVMSGRAIERKHHVGRRTIIKALASADPPRRKKIHREPAALDGLHAHIDAMIKADPKIAIAVI
jgi:hypothetical protein